ncbi:hypothetical protein [Psychrobacter sp. AOP3-A1-26]|uniref:hypothetical protein n=1 Tax=Psychrobacter sp. AOP3-A1-26 TaxID=3457700 RepID=UPI00403668BA
MLKLLLMAMHGLQSNANKKTDCKQHVMRATIIVGAVMITMMIILAIMRMMWQRMIMTMTMTKNTDNRKAVK